MVKPTAVVVDMDGTLVDVSSIRHFVAGHPDGSFHKKDFDSFHRASVDCDPIWSTVHLVDTLSEDHDIVIVTARSQQYYALTAWWLATYGIPHVDIFMREEGDQRPDYQVKQDILRVIRQKWDVVSAIDDNPSVVALWLEEGIPTTVIPGWSS